MTESEYYQLATMPQREFVRHLRAESELRRAKRLDTIKQELHNIGMMDAVLQLGQEFGKEDPNLLIIEDVQSSARETLYRLNIRCLLRETGWKELPFASKQVTVEASLSDTTDMSYGITFMNHPRPTVGYLANSVPVVDQVRGKKQFFTQLLHDEALGRHKSNALATHCREHYANDRHLSQLYGALELTQLVIDDRYGFNRNRRDEKPALNLPPTSRVLMAA